MTKKQTDFDLEAGIKKLEEIEQAFGKANLSLPQAVKKHEEALALGKKILAYLEDVETTVQELELPERG